jgi:G3E family GTPase
MNTGRFDFERAYTSAAWIDAMEHPEEHDDPEVLEYDIDTFVYQARKPFDMDKLNGFVKSWPRSIVRAKGMVWVSQDPDMCYVFEQAGHQFTMTPNGYFIASAPEEERAKMLLENPDLMNDWDDACGDRQTKVCIIGRHMNKQAIVAALDECLTDYKPKQQ